MTIVERNPYTGTREFLGPNLDQALYLHKFDSAIFGVENIRCHKTPPNLIGALLFLKHIEELKQVYRENQLQWPDRYNNPITFTDSSELWIRDIYDSDRDKPIKSPDGEIIRTGRVMFKHVCGVDAGVVIEGDYAGLLVEKITTSSENRNNTGDNDEFLRVFLEKYFNDGPSFEPENGILKLNNFYRVDWANISPLSPHRRELDKILYNDYKDNARPTTHLSTIFLRLLNEVLGIRIPITQFNRTVYAH